MKQSKKQKITLLLSSALAIGLLALLFRRVDLPTFWATVQSFATGGKLSGLLVCCYVYVILQGLRFSILYPGRATLLQHIGLNFGNHTGNILVPGRMGEAIRPLYLKRWWPSTPLKDVIKWAVVEKFAELGSMVLFVITGLVVWGAQPETVTVLPQKLPWLVAAASSAVVGAALWRKTRQAQTGRVEKILWALALSYVTWMVNTLGVYAVTGDMRMAFALLVTMTLASAVPMLPAGLGATQWAAVALANFMHLAEGEALAYSSALHLTWIFVRLSVGFPLLFFVWGWPKTREMEMVKRNEE
jgi:uncharacterized membrane protein YbhN (UPF0104 family)